MNKVVTTLMKVTTASSCLAVVLGICGCSWLNGDPLWLGGGQKSVTVRKRVSTLFDTQYDLKSGNMPFTFVSDGGDVELGLFGHVGGCPDPNDRISKDAVIVFEVADEGYGATVFSISNGVLRLERKGEGFDKAYVAYSSEVDRPELPLDVLEKGVDVVDCLLDLHCVKNWGFSIHLAHRTTRKRGEWGKWTSDRQMIVIFEFDDRPHDAPKVVFRKLEGARLFRLASL